MSFDFPTDRRYRESHEYLTTDAPHRVGISDFAQDELGDVVFVEHPSEGDRLSAGDSFGVVESIKAVSDLYAPVSGEVTAVNEELFDAPELLNDAPYDDGWMLELDPDDESEIEELMTADEYAEQVE
jgi:glycine cleavage system H protein